MVYATGKNLAGSKVVMWRNQRDTLATAMGATATHRPSRATERIVAGNISWSWDREKPGGQGGDVYPPLALAFGFFKLAWDTNLA